MARDDATLDAPTIRAAVTRLRANEVHFSSTRYQQPIDPYWLRTPERRGALWEAIARVVALDEKYGSQD